MLISFWDRGVDVLNHFTRFCRTPLTFDTNYQKFDILKVFMKRKFSKNYFSIKSTFNSNFVVKKSKNNAQLSVDTSFVRIFQEKTQFKTKRKKFQQQHKYC